MKDSIKTVNYYSPLKIKMEPDDYESSFNDYEELDNRNAAQYFDNIRDTVDLYNYRTMNQRGLMEYFDDNQSISDKIISAFPSVEMVNGEMYGIMITKQNAPLTPEEQKQFIEYVRGQYNWGGDFEQREIETACGNLYVSFWQSGNDFFIKTEDEFEDYSQSYNMQIGGL